MSEFDRVCVHLFALISVYMLSTCVFDRVISRTEWLTRQYKACRIPRSAIAITSINIATTTIDLFAFISHTRTHPPVSLPHFLPSCLVLLCCIHHHHMCWSSYIYIWWLRATSPNVLLVWYRIWRKKHSFIKTCHYSQSFLGGLFDS